MILLLAVALIIAYVTQDCPPIQGMLLTAFLIQLVATFALDIVPGFLTYALFIAAYLSTFNDSDGWF